MSLPTLGLGQLRTWSEDEIEYREHLIRRISRGMIDSLTSLNPAWQFMRIESPVLIPKNQIDLAYTSEDIFHTDDTAHGYPLCLAPETTIYSYLYAADLIKRHQRFPFCVWQVRKSFRKESLDGANAAKMRYKEFYQMEFQCFFTKGTKADIHTWLVGEMTDLIATGYRKVRNTPSDRLPSYSLKTTDIEVFDENADESREIASISERTDFFEDADFRGDAAHGVRVVEVAFGLDRLVQLKAKDTTSCGL
jgi:glycyl-tRNA synthetase